MIPRVQLEFGIVLGVLTVAAVTVIGARLRIAGPMCAIFEAFC